MEDRELIRRCQHGEKAAFQELISKYHPYVFKFLVKLTGNDQLAEDLTQDIFIKVIRSIDKFEIAGKARFSTYIITMSKNIYIDYLRKEKRSIPIDPLEYDFINDKSVPGFEDSVVNKIYSTDIMDQIEKLTEEQKMAIKLKYIEGLTLKEIGEMLNVEPKTVKSRIHNGMVKLKELLKTRGDLSDREF
ncbi:RNA polymerase sigma factor [Dehalobacter sp. TeCB1]|uniref:RNA polymerase sigma factor n=1 Tax=Dehalobacter sp. TeCB1 TaxID=1843715 RepID=UPI00083AA723|nr:RNA polymerase sigma factor [Dehalobacter sp. TeCB1]OCZ49828.1 RNA polymerase subunit sigma-24 [Dehalobacter sp. TeCB1]